nr:LysR family transcriptional regulator [Plesiocystis pacifica]
MDLLACRQLLEVVETRSISEAAKRLGVSRPALSRRLSALEQQLGLALLHRTTREVRPTAAGRRLVARVAPLFAELDAVKAELAAERDEVVGRLTVSVPPPIANEVGALVARLQDEHPKLEVALSADAMEADLRAGDIEVALRAGTLTDADLVCRYLTRRPVRAVASPAYLARAGALAGVDDLSARRLLLNAGRDGAPNRRWPLLSGGWVEVSGCLASNSQQAVLSACLRGGGVALLSEVSYGPPLARGELELVLPELVGASLTLHAVTAQRTLQPARVRAFIDAAARWFST